jgi:hypothetical protein
MKFIIVAISFVLLISSIECRYRIPTFTATHTTIRAPVIQNPTFYRIPVNTLQTQFPYSNGRISGQTQYIPNNILHTSSHHMQSNTPIQYNPLVHGSSWADRIRIERMNEDSQNNKARGKTLY